MWKKFSKNCRPLFKEKDIETLAAKRARTSGECSDAIDACVESIQFPKFLQSKALHLKAQFRTILCDALIDDKEQNKSNEWYFIRDQRQIHLVADIPTCIIRKCNLI